MPRRKPEDVEPYEEPTPRRRPRPRADTTPETIVYEDHDYDADVVVEMDEQGVTKKVKLDLEVDTSVKDLGVNPFKNIIHLARAVDSWRIFPRIFISVYIYLLYEVVLWAMEVENLSLEQSGLVSIIVGAGAAWFGLYVGSGRRKNPDE